MRRMRTLLALIAFGLTLTATTHIQAAPSIQTDEQITQATDPANLSKAEISATQEHPAIIGYYDTGQITGTTTALHEKTETSATSSEKTTTAKMRHTDHDVGWATSKAAPSATTRDTAFRIIERDTGQTQTTIGTSSIIPTAPLAFAGS